MRRFTVPLVAALLAAVTALTPAHARDTGSLPYPDGTGVGVHNAYEKSAFRYLADALDSGAAMLELDVWTNGFGSGWRVSHDTPLWNDNNCVGATTPDGLRSGARDRRLEGCLSDLRTWSDAHPGHRPILLKFEMKDGFNAVGGRGPAAFDALVDRHLGQKVYRPAELAAGHRDLDEAVRAKGWPSRAELAGRFLIHLIPGTVEEGNPFDTLWTDREYATHLRDLAAGGRLASATAFPAVHHAEAGDPRVRRYSDASLRPWFVVFDGDASAYTDGSIDTRWYLRHNYLLVMTSVHRVPPAIDGRNPTEAQALARVGQLAAAGASVASSDWVGLPSVLAAVVPRGG
ncbi:hypothetical protein GL263_22980 [Streptomyces durbertensis]|uniref:Uncharacterized protein n=1 Tax=Streptomyces durbertensis TaxID=2448886 RepID=A0ABR6EM41_9ACTN|nr:phosphatidylinositol-specific phospholipase C domain-containing protein [Streptomyces durbertensis]MBB1246395.1 hypothetical protein [Streptomyces durbertensis]